MCDNAKQSATNRAIQTTAEATGHLIGNKYADKTTKVSKHYWQNSQEIVECETEISPNVYICLRHKDRKLLMIKDNHVIKNSNDTI